MHFRVASFAAVVSLSCLASLPRTAAAQELQNDGFVAGASVTFSAGFATGEIAAARFVPSGPAQLATVRLLYGGGTATAMRTIRLHVWDDAAGASAPGAELYAGDFSVTPSDTTLTDLDLIGSGVSVTGPFRVGVEFLADGLPSVAPDTDGTIDAAANFVSLTGVGWTRSSTVGFTGDFVLRAIVLVPVDAGAPVDASFDASSLDASTDASSADAATTDAATPVDSGAHDAASPTDSGASGGACRSNAECTVGQYCSAAGVCSFDCRTSADCAGGGTCSSLGQCVAPTRSGCGCHVGARDHGGLALGGAALAWAFARRRRQTGPRAQKRRGRGFSAAAHRR